MKRVLIVAGAAGVAGLVALLWMRRAAAKVETRMVVTMEPPSNVSPGQEFSFSGYLEDINGNRLAGKFVELYVDGERAGGVTNSEGKWIWNLGLDKSSVLYAAFPGDEAYAGCFRRW